MPLDARRYLRKMRGGAQAHLIECSDGHAYVVKFLNNPQHRRILVNELVASALLKHLQIYAPETALVSTSEEFVRANPEACIALGTQRTAPQVGWHFGSRYPGDPATTAIYDFVPDALLAQLANPRDFLGVLVFDKWTANSDGRQAIFLRAHLRDWDGQANPQRMGFVALMIDHGFIFNGPNWDFPESAAQGLYPRRTVYEAVRSMRDFEPWLERVLHFPEQVLDSAWKAIPPEWITDEETQLEATLEKLWKRRDRVEQMLAEIQRGRISPFSNWAA